VTQQIRLHFNFNNDSLAIMATVIQFIHVKWITAENSLQPNNRLMVDHQTVNETLETSNTKVVLHNTGPLANAFMMIGVKLT